MSDKTLVLFGAGKIGRSFIAQIFARNGYTIAFIDVDTAVIQAINAQGRYRVVTLENNGTSSEYWVEGVRGVDGRDVPACVSLLSTASLVATSVGAGAIPAVCKTIATASQHRYDNKIAPFNLILAENMRNSADTVRQELTKLAVPSQAFPALIEASIGKTAPDVPADELSKDPLVVYTDSYNTLVVSADWWHGEPPMIPQLKLTSAIEAYVDRKLFVHNLAHCALAYFGHQDAPTATYIHEVMAVPSVYEKVARLIDVSCAALVLEYSQEFTEQSMDEYRHDVFERIANPALNDTVWRVGQDITRKIGRTDRIVGSLLMALKHGLNTDIYIELYRAALSFHATNESGEESVADRAFHTALQQQGISHALYGVSKFDNNNTDEEQFVAKLLHTAKTESISINKI